MAMSDHISLQRYADSANQRFQESENNLSKIKGSFETRMDGKTTGSLIFSIFGTICWLVVFCAFFWYIIRYIDSTLCLICLGVAMVLIFALLIDEFIGLTYYGKISSYKDNVTRLKNRVSKGRSSIRKDLDTFMRARANGWQHPLAVGTSVSEEADAIVKTMGTMESLKGGLISKAKDIFFYAFVVIFTGIGSWSLFGVVSEIVYAICEVALDGEMPLDSDILTVLCIIALVIVEVIEVILAKLVWSKTDCSVTNITLLIAPAGPILFLAFCTIVALLVILVVFVVSFLIAIAGFVIAAACLCSTFSGG